MSKIREWLKSPDASSNYVSAVNKMTEGTGVWLVQDSRFQDWKKHGGLMWLQGKGDIFICVNSSSRIFSYINLIIAGSGKTFLT